MIGLNVTDESVIEMTERREQAPSLPVMVYLENDVKELADDGFISMRRIRFIGGGRSASRHAGMAQIHHC
ncbi:MAG: hypothetical protein V8T87_09685 [Victivallales bacterium]